MSVGQTVISTNKKQKKRERLRVGEPGFESPDGGWAWLILVACGISNLVSFPIFQQYGLVFKEKFKTQGISSTEIVTIINTCIAFNTGAGLLNGPVFKRFTTRKVGIFSAVLLVGCLIMCAFCRSFWMYIIFFSIGYGGAFGLLESANALAMNTYFGKKRRIATGLSWTITAVGPVVCPYIVIALMSKFGMEGTILLFSGVSMHSLVCSLLLQPVHWHTKFRDEATGSKLLTFPSKQDSGKLSRISSAIFQSQYLENDTGAFTSESPMMLVGSKLSLTSEHENKPRNRSNSTLKHPNHHGNEDRERKSSVIQSPISETQEKTAVDIEEEKETDTMLEKPEKQPLGFWQQIIQDFDFALLKDPVYVNLMLGLTMTNFVELNFGLLTPVIMAELNFQHHQIAIFMSLLAGFDILFRFLVSIVADKVKISNRNFYLLGITVMMIGRTVFMHTHTYTMSLVAAAIIGSGKALRTIFLILVIPSHVPLERLPAAYGLQYAFSLLFFVIGGPIAGWIRETVGNYFIQIHMLNILTYATIISWLLEGRISTYLKNKKLRKNETNPT
ncbi:unnamed protein product [Phaedon cochleariae]|uniref:Monocarboxylate transporter n=1 Tax=Phaedon cochleariae TaxID=80249 RepID=A0A9P0GTA0_PHACE|nr:unnamed protein product [Phaedon cochleariae]